MRMNMDYTGVNEAGNFDPAPRGVYRLKIAKVEDGKTQYGDPKAVVELKIVAGAYAGKNVRHTVTFKAPDQPGAGFAKHWLRVIGQPFEGRVSVDTERWPGQEIIARLGVEQYKDKNGEMRDKNVIEESWSIKDEDAPALGELPAQEPKANGGKYKAPAPAQSEANEDSVPF